jgi:hypothetical protein
MSVCLTLLVLIVGQARGVEAEAIRFTDRTAFEAALTDPIVVDYDFETSFSRLTFPPETPQTFERRTYGGLASFDLDPGFHIDPPSLDRLFGTRFEVPVTAVGLTIAPWQKPPLPGQLPVPVLDIGFSFFGEFTRITEATFFGIVLDEPSLGVNWLQGESPDTPLTLSPLTVQTAVPEPATWGLLLLGVVAIGFAAARGVKP